MIAIARDYFLELFQNHNSFRDVVCNAINLSITMHMMTF